MLSCCSNDAEMGKAAEETLPQYLTRNEGIAPPQRSGARVGSLAIAEYRVQSKISVVAQRSCRLPTANK